MEVHTHGWPRHLAEDAVKKRLQPFMDVLGIAEHTFTCDKPRNQQWANLTFLDVSKAEAFLHRHGTEFLPPRGHAGTASMVNGYGNHRRQKGVQLRARLQLMGCDILCSKSKPKSIPNAVPGKPNDITLRALKHAAAEKNNPTRHIEIAKGPLVFDFASISCGHTTFVGEDLVYIPEVEFQDMGTAKFTRQTLLIKLESQRVIRIPLNTVQDLVCSFQHTLTITLAEEPSFFQGMDQMQDLFRELAISVGGRPPNFGPTRTRLCALDGQHAKVVGQCLVYQIRLSGDGLQRKIRSLKSHEVIPFVSYDLLTLRTAPLHLGPSSRAMSKLMKDLAVDAYPDQLPFGILFQLQAMATNAYFHPGTVLALAKELRRMFLADKAAGRRPISVEAMKKLMKETPWPKPHGDPSMFEVQAIVEYLRETEDKMGNNEVFRQGLMGPTRNLALIHRVTITPTRSTLHGPELETNNRILRKYPDHHEYFLRVQFCDENGEDLFFNPQVSIDNVYDRFKEVFRKGFVIAGRKYEFLGFSHSSLRSHSAWFMAQFVANGIPHAYFNVIGDLGQFGAIRSPARCAARIGQAFSETPYFIPLDECGVTVRLMDDVQRNGRVFSDGVGTMSLQVVYHIWDVIPQTKSAPTAFQVRFRGSKGMLALDSNLDGSEIRIRPSMTKFESNDKRNLEICDMASKPIPLVLNRQIIKILEDMGCASAWFFRMQNMELARLREVTADAYNVAKFLRHQNVGDTMRLHRLITLCENMGVDYRKESFLRSVVEALVLRELRLLKHKARIPIRKGITLFGIMDETGFLQENEVYITYDTKGDRFDEPPGPGPVVVTRSPALHPGDIQVPCNVVPPHDSPLRELSNVIVFSQHGQRDLPSQLSGGDLDGDIFNVIWDEEAMPQETFQPADYARVAPVDLGRKVEREDMANFFIDFMKLDHLGVIATRHMILADQHTEGTRHEECKILAGFHSTAVDFSKTGVGVNLKEAPRPNRFRPDFLASGPDCRVVDKSEIELDQYIIEEAADEEEDQFSRPRHVFYKSEKLLGHLFRAIDEQRIWQQDIKSKVPATGGSSFWDDFLSKTRPHYEAIVDDPRGWVSRLETAREIRGWYEEAISTAMGQYSSHPTKPLRELEVFIGNVLNKSGVQTQRQRDSSIKLKDEMSRIATWITRQMRKVNHDAEGNVAPPTGYQTELDNLHLCLACVHAGCEETAGPRESRFEGMQSFRIVAACALLSEISLFDNGQQRAGGGGGFVGVSGGRRNAAAAMNGRGRYAMVPPPAEGGLPN
ncbi:hypothetical protein KVR01_007222 [Diaporthe batatas]|uniref:uncharacterized protein n=1 Tax=Diaporthe batatas TaxID=748121 RepID=UPI001D054757|nr:uncharacterized protein KVR01_007222 [Diaporthe batatas]KAG8162744.1 hypothetical protein KVR01_007222 [Diaporthe batatas]